MRWFAFLVALSLDFEDKLSAAEGETVVTKIERQIKTARIEVARVSSPRPKAWELRGGTRLPSLRNGVRFGQEADISLLLSMTSRSENPPLLRISKILIPIA
jgi:hypothetical protein